MVEPLIGAAAAAPDLIKDSDSQNFMVDVIEASQEVPVVVDFWAPWCGPCKQLGPVIEKVVKSAQGKVKLVKINIDDSPEIAQQLRIQSIPAVFAFHQGQPVDAFVGAQSESQIKAFVEKLAGSIGPSPVDEALEAAKAALDAGDVAAAGNLYGQVVQADPGQSRSNRWIGAVPPDQSRPGPGAADPRPRPERTFRPCVNRRGAFVAGTGRTGQ